MTTRGKCAKSKGASMHFSASMFFTGRWMCRPGYDGGEADDAAAADGG